MTAWGTGPFENDDAHAWVTSLIENGPEWIEKTLDQPYTSVVACEQIVAAAEAVAALSGHPHLDWPTQHRAWIKRDHDLDLPSLRIKAVGSMLDVMNPQSPLRQQWVTFYQDSVWLMAMGNLIARLKQSAKDDS